MHHRWDEYITTVSVIAAVLITVWIASPAFAEAPAEDPPAKPASLAELFTQGRLSATIRSYLFVRDFEDDTTDRSTLAIGGNLGFETAPVYGFSAGVGFKTGQGDTLSREDEVYGGVLATGDTLLDAEGYAALDEYYLRLKKWNTMVTGGAMRVDSPWLNANDLRLTPLKYRGLTIVNKSIENVGLHGYYIHEWLDWTAESWESVAAAITGGPEDDEGSLVGGVVWDVPIGLKLQVWDYYFKEVMNNFYAHVDGKYTWRDEYTLSAAIKYLYQSDVGDSLDGDISTNTIGGNINLSAFGATLTAYYGTNGNDELRDPFGGDWVISMQIKDLDRAEEDAWALKLHYNFDRLGATGLSAYVFFTRFDTPDSGANASPDWEEIDFNLQYKFGGWFKNLSIRLRYAIINQDEKVVGGEDWTDGRVYLQYTF